VDYFSSLELSPNAVKDWDVREVGWRVTTWEFDRPDADRDLGRKDEDGYGLGL
jgi:hypothetical protein